MKNSWPWRPQNLNGRFRLVKIIFDQSKNRESLKIDFARRDHVSSTWVLANHLIGPVFEYAVYYMRDTVILVVRRTCIKWHFFWNIYKEKVNKLIFADWKILGAHTNNFQYFDIFQETNTWINITRSIKGLDCSLVHQWFDAVFMSLCSFTQNTSKGTHHCKLGRLWTFFKIESIEIHAFELKKWMFIYNIVACNRIAVLNQVESRLSQGANVWRSFPKWQDIWAKLDGHEGWPI